VATLKRAAAGRAGSVGLGEVHAVGKLKAGDLPGALLHFKISLEQLDVDHLPLHRAQALRADIVQGLVAVVGFDKLAYHCIHDARSVGARRR
jgi:hypothetical protein